MSETRTPLQVKKDLRNQVAELKPMIHRGAQKEVAEKIGKVPSYVTEVLNGRRWDLEVIEEIIKLAEKNLKRALIAETKIQNLVAQKKKSDTGE